MGMLIDGVWHTTPVAQGGKSEEGGRFIRRPSVFRGHIEAGSRFEPTAGRYHLYVSWACPWAHRTILVRHLKGLEEAIGLSVVDYLMGDDGWRFSERSGATLDPVNHTQFLRELYQLADARYTGKVTVPVLWDTKERTIVNNESLEIIKMLDRAFESSAPALYPRALEAEIDEMIAANYETVNNGVYRAGFARNQEAYEEAVTELFHRLDQLEEHLSKNRFLVGPALSIADLCLFTTLLRFDPVYVGHFKCNLRRIADYPSLQGFLRDVYQTPGVSGLCNFEHIKGHYYQSHEALNPSRIVPKGPVLSLNEPHQRG
ncbi:MAG: glutathione S-transferase family protein [Deltaproteobacteria bacterium]|nr:glutathione S-transferase family protein [Deltaproteobacteria bacterium]